MKKISNIAFDGTKEQEQQLRAALAKLKDVPGGLMPAMQQAQDIYGYLPKEVQQIIADEMGVSLAEVYGIATFYAQGRVQVCGLSWNGLLRKGFGRYIQRTCKTARHRERRSNGR